MPFNAVIPTAEWSPEDPFEGTSFRVVRQLGRNASSSRFLVQHVTNGQRFVATLLPVEFAWDIPRMERLLTDIQLLARLQHPNFLRKRSHGWSAECRRSIR